MIQPEYVTHDANGDPISNEQRERLLQSKVRPEGFMKTNWKSGADRDQWKHLHEQMPLAKSEAEWRSVMSDKTDRSAAIIHVDNYSRDDWLERVGEHDLHYRAIRYTGQYDGGYAHEFKEIDEYDPERITYAVIAEDADIADKMEEAELEMQGFERHDTVGELLGFPSCCREWFWENWGVSTSDDKWTDPMYEIACNTDTACAIDGDNQNIHVRDPSPWNNILYRYWGYSFLTHMPCSFNCEHSEQIAKARGEIMSECGYKDAANAMYNWLDLPMVWEGRLGIAHVRNKHWIGSANSSGYWNMKRIVWKNEHEKGSVVDE